MKNTYPVMITAWMALAAIPVTSWADITVPSKKRNVAQNMQKGPAGSDPSQRRTWPVKERPFLIASRESELTPSAWLGIATEDVPPVLAAQLGRDNSRGAVVTAVVPESPAEAAALEKHDIILRMDGIEVMAPNELTEFMAGKSPGESVTLTVLRGGKELKIEATLAESPKHPAHQQVTPSGTVNVLPPRHGPFGDLFEGNRGPFAMIEEMEKEMDRMQEEMRKRFQHSFNSPSGPDSMTHIMRSNGSASYSDNDGTIIVDMKDGQKHVRATTPEGEVLFDGPANTEEELSKMPPSVRERFEKFDTDPFDMRTMPGLKNFGNLFDFEIDEPRSEGPEVKKDFRRMKRAPQVESSDDEKTGEEPATSE
ncbi:MAG: PDZ domain-containing protein [Verrucomicrobiota bacterium]